MYTARILSKNKYMFREQLLLVASAVSKHVWYVRVQIEGWEVYLLCIFTYNQSNLILRPISVQFFSLMRVRESRGEALLRTQHRPLIKTTSCELLYNNCVLWCWRASHALLLLPYLNGIHFNTL